MRIYLDVIWLLNFLFNSLLLMVTGFILKREIRKKQLFFSGFIGSLLVFAPFTPLASFFSTPLVKIAMSILMVWYSFGYKRLRYFSMNLAVFYLCTFTAGGALIGTHYLLSFRYDLTDAIFLAGVRGFGDPISWLFVLVAFPLALYFSKETFQRYETVKIKVDQIVDVTITLSGQQVKLRGLVDSGNLLYDPLTKKPVMIVSLEKTGHLIPPDFLPVFEDVNHLAKLKGEGDGEWLHKLTVIPFQVVGQENRLAAAVKPERVQVEMDEKLYETDQLFIVFVKQRLSSEDLFDCIVHPKMVGKGEDRRVS